jgi:hypothetical protein
MGRATLLVSFTMPRSEEADFIEREAPKGEPKSEAGTRYPDQAGNFSDGPIKFPARPQKLPVWSRRELLGNALIPLSYLERLADVGVLNERNSVQIPS